MEEKKEVTIQEIQSKLLEILLYFQKFCQENGLGFVLAGGTCLGAVRHKGFIPWDDDVDVFMLRDDYEKLCRIWDEKADTEHYSCVRSNDQFNIRHSATEIKDNNTTFINRHSVDLDIHQGLMIDVIPLDAVPKSKWKQLWQMLYEEIGPEFWVAMAWTILINLARLASLILCVYAACMIAHQFPKHVMVAGILAFIGLNIVETQLDKLLGTNDVSMIVDVTYRVVGVNVTGVSYGVTPMRWLTAALGTDVGYLFCFAVTAALAAAYFFLTRWLMKNKLNLE